MILAILQARMSSSRLPGKVLMPVLGEPMLFRQIERLRRCKTFNALVVATSDENSDDALAAACKERGVLVARGSRDDVLDRFLTAARPHKPDAVVRLTGVCPLADPAIVDAVVTLYRQNACDYASNIEPPTYPDGLDVEVVRFSALEQAGREGKLPSEREHVTPYVRNHRELFRHKNLTGPVDLSALRWTVDEPSDFAFVSAIYERLYPANPAFDMADVLNLLRREPSLADINVGIERNEGMKKSLEADLQFRLSATT